MTELIWDGKYDKATGKKIAPPRIALPFQDIETVNESAADRDRNLSLFGGGKSSEWRNRLIWGDKRYVLPSLLPEFAGKVNLIYIDPPFDTGANFSYLATIPDAPDRPSPLAPRPSPGRGVTALSDEDSDEDDGADEAGQGPSRLSFEKRPSMIEQKAYRDTWGKGLDSYLKWFYETVVLLRELLADDGSIYVHVDWHVSAYVKAILDQEIGYGAYLDAETPGFRNEIIWHYQSGGRQENLYSRKHDTIYLYSKGKNWTFDSDSIAELRGTAKRNNMKRGVDVDGRTFFSIKSAGKIYKYYEDEKITPPDVWVDISHLQQKDPERLGYNTQKPEALLERVIKASSSENDLILDCFCGSGTTAAVAEKLGRRWITCDLGRFAIHTARKRLLGIEGVKPFVVQNLGKYERQQWQKAEFGDDAEAKTQEYRKFILTLYRARPITGYIWLHGLKNGHMVHVGGVDAPISVNDVAQAAAEFKRSRGTGTDAPTQNSIDLLGWDFAFELNEVAKQQAALTGVDVKFVRIPREVLEKKAVEQGDIKFFELAALSVDSKITGKNVMLTLKDFVIPLDDVPQEIQSAIAHWEQWIDYWAVDWDNKGDTFHNQWQSYRTRQSKTIQRQIVSPPGTYTEPGEYKVVVKVIDILGNDTTKTLKVTVV